MPIDFSQVKTITIPEGSVKKITDSTGNILWKEQSAEWHTVWEGNKTIKASANKNITGAISNFASTANGTGFTPHLRITFLFNTGDTSGTDLKYYNNDRTPMPEKPTSPLEIESVVGDDNMIVLGRYQNYPYEFTVEALLVKYNDTSNNKISFSLKGQCSTQYSHSSSYYVSMTITKIEQYY